MSDTTTPVPEQLRGQTVLVTGATGQVGWGVAHAALEAGARVVLPSRSERGVTELRAEFGVAAAAVLHADVGTAQGRTAVLEAARAGGGLEHVFAPLGAWWQKGASLAQDASELRDLLETYTTVQFELVQSTAPLLSVSGGSYTMVTGAAGEHLLPGAGLLVVAVRAQYALSEVLRTELAQADFRYNELRIATRIERVARPGVVPSREAGRAFVALMGSSQRGAIVRYP